MKKLFSFFCIYIYHFSCTKMIHMAPFSLDRQFLFNLRYEIINERKKNNFRKEFFFLLLIYSLLIESMDIL